MPRFAFRCPRVWDAPPVDGRRFCEQCSRWVTDLTALPDLDVDQWVRENPGSCARVVVDAGGRPLSRIPSAAVLATVSLQPCAPAEHARVEVEVEVVAPAPEEPETLEAPAAPAPAPVAPPAPAPVAPPAPAELLRPEPVAPEGEPTHVLHGYLDLDLDPDPDLG